MALQQVVQIFLTIQGDGSATVFTFGFNKLWDVTLQGDTLINPGTIPSSAAVLGQSSSLPTSSASIDANGNLIITFDSAPANGVSGQVQIQLFFNSGALGANNAAWTSATALNTTLSIPTAGMGTVVLTYNPVSSAFTQGSIWFEVSDDGGTTWYAINGERGNQQFVPDNGYILNAVAQTWQFTVAGFTNFRVRLNPVIVGSGTANFHVLTLAGILTDCITVGQGLGKFLHMTIDGGSTGLVADVTLPGVQGAAALCTQDIIDTGRTQITFYVDQLTGVTSEALATMQITKALVAQTAANNYSITAGKRLRIKSISATVKNTTSTLASSRIRVRAVPSGTVSASSPIIFTLDIPGMTGTQAANVGNTIVVPIPDGLEIPSGANFGFSHIESTTSSNISVCIEAFEY